MKLLFFVSVDWYFCSHRLPLAVAAKEAGYDVIVVTREGDHGSRIREAGLRLIPLDCSRGSTNPFSECKVVARLTAIYLRERPDIVHHIAMKPVVYGSIAARLARVPMVINALTGMGYIFSSRSLLARLLMSTVRTMFRFLLRRGQVIVQNQDDAELVRALGVNDLVVIRGSGVDKEQFAPTPEAPLPPVIMLASRLLWDKGVGEFVEAARVLKAEGANARFVLVGAPDAENRSSVDHVTLNQWAEQGAVEWWGRRDDMPKVLAQAHIACLPSYREGVPKSLIEAAAAGLPIVTTDTPGCREIVIDGGNGFLVPARDSKALADTLWLLINDGALRKRMGQRGRAIVEAEFTSERVVEETLAVYRGLALSSGLDQSAAKVEK